MRHVVVEKKKSALEKKNHNDRCTAILPRLGSPTGRRRFGPKPCNSYRGMTRSKKKGKYIELATRNSPFCGVVGWGAGGGGAQSATSGAIYDDARHTSLYGIRGARFFFRRRRTLGPRLRYCCVIPPYSHIIFLYSLLGFSSHSYQ